MVRQTPARRTVESHLCADGSSPWVQRRTTPGTRKSPLAVLQGLQGEEEEEEKEEEEEEEIRNGEQIRN